MVDVIVGVLAEEVGLVVDVGLTFEVVEVVAVAVRGGLCDCDSPWLNSSNLAKPVDGRRPAALFTEESSTRIDRDRVKRFANRGLAFFCVGSKSGAVFLGAGCCVRLAVEEAPLFSFSAARAIVPGKSDVDSVNFVIDDLRSLELPRLLGGSVEFSELSERCVLWEDLGAFNVPKNDFEASRECLCESFGEGKYWGIAVKPGVEGSGAVSAFKLPGEVGIVGLVALELESCVTGRMVAPLKKGELEPDFGDFGVKGLSPSEL